jgi:tRNA pseudouridine38-40 synthase
MSRKIKLLIEYDGTVYGGWQVQPNAVTIQEKIEEAIFKVTGEIIRIYAAGRTDAGVHALGQVAHFETESDIPANQIRLAINSNLKDDIRIRKSEEASSSFHARYGAKGKVYRYSIYNDYVASAVLRNTTYNVKEKLDITKLKAGAKYFIGEHDFSTYCSSGSDVIDKVRTIFDIRIKESLPLIEIDFEGSGFLYNMVRNMVGTLINVGKGKISPDDILDIIESKDRARAAFTAPAKGLCLLNVAYDE